MLLERALSISDLEDITAEDGSDEVFNQLQDAFAHSLTLSPSHTQFTHSSFTSSPIFVFAIINKLCFHMMCVNYISMSFDSDKCFRDVCKPLLVE